MRIGDRVQYVGLRDGVTPMGAIGTVVKIIPSRWGDSIHVRFPDELPMSFTPSELAVVKVANQ